VTLILDTLRFSKLLQDKGHFSAAQADTLAETIGTVGTESLATKTGIAELRVTISQLRSELKTEIGALRSELQKWIVGAIGVQTLVMVGLILTLARSMTK
jgi:hypothetical protein